MDFSLWYFFVPVTYENINFQHLRLATILLVDILGELFDFALLEKICNLIIANFIQRGFHWHEMLSIFEAALHHLKFSYILHFLL